jgi:hypothetical protein
MTERPVFNQVNIVVRDMDAAVGSSPSITARWPAYGPAQSWSPAPQSSISASHSETPSTTNMRSRLSRGVGGPTTRSSDAATPSSKIPRVTALAS